MIGTAIRLDTACFHIVTFRNSSVSLADHAFNKFVWGGNRGEPDFTGRTDGHATSPDAGHVFIDDIIVHGSRIGPTYFGLIPSPPRNLRIP